MANYSTLKAAVEAVVKTNGEQAITGANMQTVLLSIINSIGGGGYIFEGVATPSTNAGTPDQNVFYIGGAGTYANFGTSVVVLPTNIAVFKYNGSWTCEQVTVENGGVFDISAFHAVGGTLATYADLAAALGTGGANVPEGVRKGGMSIKFVRSFDNKYVQYRLMSPTWSATEDDWQGVDEIPTPGSENLVKSGGVADIIDAIIGSDDTNVDLSIYSATNRDIGYSTGLWQNNTSDYQHIVLPVKVGRKYAIVSNSGIALQYTLLKSYSAPVVGQSADFCNGWSVVQKSIGVSDEFIVPSDCAFLYIRTKNRGTSAAVSLTLKGVEGEIPAIKEDISQIESDIDSLNNDMDSVKDEIIEIAGEDAVVIDLSTYTSNPYLGKLDFTSPYGWSGTSAANNKKHIIVPVLASTSYTLLAKETGTLSLRYAFLKSYTGTSNAPDYCNGYGKPYNVAKGTATKVTTPSDCTCLYLQYQDGASSIADLSVTKNATKGRLDKVEEEVSSLWADKKIAWFGTSIPAGSNFSIPIKANAIDAYITSYKIEKTTLTEDDNLPCEYPVIAASLLGAKTIYNEAVGSSRIVKNTTDSNLLIRCKALTNTVEEICSYIWGSYIIDIANQTFEENHNNTIGITTFLTTAGTWSSFVNNVMICLSQSYQIKLTLRHLISDSTQRSSYIQDVFGEYYDRVVAMLTSVSYTLDDLVGYGEADLFVLEHSVNDSNPSMEYPVTSTDVTTFQGAYNKIIGEILRYKPSTRIVIVSNYGPDTSEIQYDKDKTAKLKEIAEHWQIAFCEMRKYINVSATKQMTQGYWEQNTNVWHDSGFQWSEDAENDSFTTNAYFHPDLYNSSLTVIKQNINPQLIHGVWYWEAPARYIWMRDAVHPHSDNSGRLCIILAKTLAKWLDNIGNI